MQRGKSTEQEEVQAVAYVIAEPCIDVLDRACVEECPVSISPLDIIIELRRSLIMEDSNAPQEWNGMFSNIENNFAPWKFSPDDRDKWVEEMK